MMLRRRALERKIAEERAAYLLATWACHEGEALYHERIVDDLLRKQQHHRSARR